MSWHYQTRTTKSASTPQKDDSGGREEGKEGRDDFDGFDLKRDDANHISHSSYSWLRATSGLSIGQSNNGGRWITVLFLLLLAGVYHLGLQEGKNEAAKRESDDFEDVEEKREPWHTNISTEQIHCRQ